MFPSSISLSLPFPDRYEGREIVRYGQVAADSESLRRVSAACRLGISIFGGAAENKLSVVVENASQFRFIYCCGETAFLTRNSCPARCAPARSSNPCPPRYGCQMPTARFLDHVCLALRASELWLRYATLQNFIPSFPWIAPPRPPSNFAA